MIYSDLYKKRKKIYYNIINGKYSNIRLFSILFFLIFYFFIPFLQHEGKQAILLDIVNYKIYFFNYIFYPNDFVIFCIVILIFLIMLFLITLLYGRLWCGYLCPQTLMLYVLNIFSIFFEGNRNHRIKFDNYPIDFKIFFLKFLKHLFFLFFLFLVSIVFVGYFVPITFLIKNIIFFNFNNLSFFIIFFITSLLYFETVFLGEQFCFLICPYARFQNIMYDEGTKIVKYDFLRGEPRKSKKKNINIGDCINCFQCVYSCPTGIDIRDGIQIECINCGVCVDACNNVMLKVNKKIDLISYQRDSNINLFIEKLFKKKKYIFLFVFLFLFFIFISMLSNRNDLDFVVYRNQNTLCNRLGNFVENSYIMKIINKTNSGISCFINVYSIDNIDLKYIGPLELYLTSDYIHNIYVKINAVLKEYENKKFYTLVFNIKYFKNKVAFCLKKEINFFIF